MYLPSIRNIIEQSKYKHPLYNPINIYIKPNVRKITLKEKNYAFQGIQTKYIGKISPKKFISITKVSSQLLTALLQEFHLMGMKFVIDGQNSIIPL